MKWGTALLLALAIFAPACLCSLHAAPEKSAEHACCTTEQGGAPVQTDDGCGQACNHCAANYEPPQDQPKAVSFDFSMSLLAVLPRETNGGAGVLRWAPVPAPLCAESAPPGRVPAYLLHCRIIC